MNTDVHDNDTKNLNIIFLKLKNGFKNTSPKFHIMGGSN